MGRNQNMEVFEDTKLHCINHAILKESISNSNANQRIIREQDALELPMPRYNEEAKLIVSKRRSFEAAAEYKEQKVCVLNFASASNAGGGVIYGADAQEESLCRCSTLFFNLDTEDMRRGFYNRHRKQKNPLHNDDLIYTPGVKVFKTDSSVPRFMLEKDWYNVDVITCAAPNLRDKPSNFYNTGDGDMKAEVSNDELLHIFEQRFRRILQVASLNGNEVVILGAFGCGGFKNPPKLVAQAAKKVVREFAHHFETIEFAVYCSATESGNYLAFEQIFHSGNDYNGRVAAV